MNSVGLRQRLGTPRTKRALSAVLLAAAVVFAVVALRGNWNDVRADLLRMSPLDLAASALGYAAALLMLWRSWSALLTGIGARPIGRHDSIVIFLASQLGKYVPGSVWPVVIQSQLGRRNDIAPSMMVNAYALFAALLCGTGGLVGLGALTGSGADLPVLVIAGSAITGVVVVTATIHDHGLTKLISWLLRKLGRGAAPLRLDTACGLRSVAWAIGSWLMLGLHIFALARPLGAQPADLGLVTGGFALAFVAGLLVLPLPAGAGVREAVIVLTIGVALGRPAAIAIALVSRFLMIMVELVMATASGVPRAASWARTKGDRASTGTERADNPIADAS